MTNTYQSNARYIKARKIAQVFIDKQVTAEELEKLDDDGWSAAAGIAGTHVAGAETRAIIIHFVESHAATKADDPFRGFPSHEEYDAELLEGSDNAIILRTFKIDNGHNITIFKLLKTHGEGAYGWQCSDCSSYRDGEEGYQNALTAEEGAVDFHGDSEW